MNTEDTLKEFDEEFCNFWHPTVLKKLLQEYPDLEKNIKSFIKEKLELAEKNKVKEIVKEINHFQDHLVPPVEGNKTGYTTYAANNTILNKLKQSLNKDL